MALRRFIADLRNTLQGFEEVLNITLGLGKNPRSLGTVCVEGWGHISPPPLTHEADKGFLWGVPRNRRTIEKRWKRKYGSPYYSMKMMQPRLNLNVCLTCGHFHETRVLCPHCYARVTEETKAAQDAVQEELGLSAVDKDVVLIYDGESSTQQPEGKRVVEVRRPRPQWFTSNLLQRSTDVPSPKVLAIREDEVASAPSSKTIKPSDLG